MTVKVLFAILQLGLVLAVAWAKSDSEKKQKAIDLKKEVDDAVKSGDVQRVNLLIQSIGRLR